MLVLPAELTHGQAAACLGMLEQGLTATAGQVVQVDASALSRFDSSALAVLLGFRRACKAVGKRLTIHGMPARLRSLSDLYGLSDLLVPESA